MCVNQRSNDTVQCGTPYKSRVLCSETSETIKCCRIRQHFVFRTSGQEELTRMQQSIQRSTATALESERIGTEVIEDLNYQRERLSGARDRLQEANTGIF